MGAEKSALAILDKEGDKDMKTRIALTPITFLGPIAFVPIIAIGVIVDVIAFNFTGVVTIIASAIALSFYIVSFVLSIMVLKTEVKAQNKALEILQQEQMADEDEREMMKKLFKLYNIQYVNDLVLQLLEIILRVLMIFANAQSSSSSSSSSN